MHIILISYMVPMVPHIMVTGVTLLLLPKYLHNSLTQYGLLGIEMCIHPFSLIYFILFK